MARSKTEFIGVIGLGNMGGGIARNLISAGHNVLVWDIADEAMKKFRRKATLTEPEEMVARCSIIFFVVPGSAEIELEFLLPCVQPPPWISINTGISLAFFGA